jgi:hypothetical protein
MPKEADITATTHKHTHKSINSALFSTTEVIKMWKAICGRDSGYKEENLMILNTVCHHGKLHHTYLWMENFLDQKN